MEGEAKSLTVTTPGTSEASTHEVEEIKESTNPTSSKEETRSPSNSSTSIGEEVVHEAPAPKSRRGTFVPKDIDINWVPKEADIVWTRFDKSRTQALAIIVRCPENKEAQQYNTSMPSVYCDTDGPDRYSLALINSDTHVYPPRHYMVKFNFETSSKLKCMKAKVSSLSSWDKSKRKAVRDALAYAEGAHKFENSHNFQKCPICCSEASEAFWSTIGLAKGNARLDSPPEKPKARVKRVQERREREPPSPPAEKPRRNLRARTRNGAKVASRDAEESEADITTISDDESQSSTGASRNGSDIESGAAASDEGVAVSESDEGSDVDEDDFSLQSRKNIKRNRPRKRRSIVSGRVITRPMKAAVSQKRVKSAVSEVEICSSSQSAERATKRRRENDEVEKEVENEVDSSDEKSGSEEDQKESIPSPG